MTYRKISYTLFSIISVLLIAPSADAQELFGNPIITHEYSADPSAHVFGDTLWVYPSHDKDDALNFTMEDYHAFSTTDMKHWQDHGVIFNPITQTSWAKSAAWAPDCIYRNGKYYLYYPTDKRHIGVAVSDSPTGPFHDPLGHPLISIDSPGVICDRDFIDPCVFIDSISSTTTKGEANKCQAYLFMGQNTVCCIKLNDDMISCDGNVHIIEGVKDFFEAVWVHKRGDIYYMSYSNGPFHGHQPQIAYCTSTSPLGPYTYQGVLLDSVNSGTNHSSIVNYKGQDYLFYHTADISRTLAPQYHCGVRRSVCCDSLFYNADGTIRKVIPTLNKEKLILSDISDERMMALIGGSVRQPSYKNMKLDIVVPKDADRMVLQAYIDSCSNNGGGKITLTKGTYFMDGFLEMKSNVNLHLCDSTTLLFSSNPDAYLPVTLTRWEGTELYGRHSMIHAFGQRNFSITGEGCATINTNGKEMAKWGMAEGSWAEVEGSKDSMEYKENVHGTHGETLETKDVNRLRDMGDKLTPVKERIFGDGTYLRPCAIEFNSCSDVLVEGITLKDSPFWCIHPLYCDNVTVRNVTIDSHFPNNDGCDPESSRRVLIENCTFRTGDDAIAIKSGRDADGRRVNRPSEDIVIRNCKFFSECNGLCIGSEMSGGVKNVYMSNIEIGKVKNALLFKSNLDRGGYINNVYVDSINIASVAGAVLRFETNYFGYRGGNFPAQYSNFRINNVTARTTDAYAIYYDGNAQAPITDISVNNFSVEKALKPYYLYKTVNCKFNNTSINGVTIPKYLKESKTRQQCDVW